MSKQIKCISLWQPWASLCCIRHPDNPNRSVKGFETRSWSTRHRGLLLIHAAQRFTEEEREWCWEPTIHGALYRVYGHQDHRVERVLPTGAIIGCVCLVECWPAMIAYAEADEYAQAMGHYAPGRWAWEITEPVLFDTPIPYRGQQGLFSVPRSVVEEQLTPAQE